MVRTMDGDSRPIDNLFASEWRLGLPSLDDLTPLSQSLISPELASAFGIMPTTCSTIFAKEPASKIEALQLFPEKSESEGSRVRRRPDSEDPDGGSDECNSCGDKSGSSGRAAKRPRLVWTPELHKRFVDVIEQLGVDKAVPKTIMEMMNVEGLTRENVASHLQKYRMYLKKAEVVPSEADSDPVPVSSPASQRRGSSAFDCGNGGFGPMLPSGMQFNSVAMMPLPLPAMVGGLGVSFGCGGGPLGVAPATGGSGDGGYYGMESAGYNAPMMWNRRGS